MDGKGPEYFEVIHFHFVMTRGHFISAPIRNLASDGESASPGPGYLYIYR